MNVSACNRIDGTIQELKKGKATTNVRVRTEMRVRLEVGQQVTACIREGNLLLAKNDALTTRNRIIGTIVNLRPRTVTTELTIRAAEGELYA